MIREEKKYEDEFYYVSQLFDENWSPERLNLASEVGSYRESQTTNDGIAEKSPPPPVIQV